MLYDDHKLKNDKKLLKLEREYIRLSRAQRDAPIVPIAEPYQKGWTRTHALREDILRRRDAPELKLVLSKYKTTIHCKNRDFVDSKGKPLNQDLRILPKKTVERFNWPPQVMKWIKLGFWTPASCWTKYTIEGYAFFPPHYFLVWDIQPYIITHQRVLYPEIETRIEEINRKFEHLQAWRRLNRLHHGSDKGGWGKSGYGTKFYSQKDRELDITHGLDPDQW